MKLLLIEDDQIIADLIEKGMHEAGYQLLHVSDGEAGLEQALSGSYDLAIVDVMLPKMDGLAVISGIRKHDNSMPIIILSAKRSVDERISGLRTGSDDYLTKPFSFSELLARVEALLRRSGGKPDDSHLRIHDLE
ncbi:MAG: response regulator, partial [Thiotrichales bacterium]|nr:response regulator [Thiotrichales bacterium]